MKKLGNVLFFYFFVFVMCMGASFAWYAWQGANIDVNVAFSSLDKYLEYRVVNIDDEGNEVAPSQEGATATKVEYNKKDIAKNLDVYGNIYLNINNVSNEKIFRESNVTWTLKAIKDGATTTVSTGNFVGENINNEIPMAINIILDEETEYIVKINQPSTESQLNLNVSGMSITTSITSESIAPDNFGSGAGKLETGYVRSIKYRNLEITDLTLYSSVDKITGYKIVNSATKPSATDSGWTSVTDASNVAAVNESGYVVNLTSVNHSMNDINNVCFKTAGNDVYCKSIGKWNDALSIPTADLCKDNVIYNGSPQQLTSVTEGTGYTLSGYNQTNVKIVNGEVKPYTITAELQDNYEWNDGTTEDITFTCLMDQKPVTVTAASDSKVYDGTALTNSTCSAEGLINGHTVTCTMTNDSTITNVGSVDNVINTTTIKSGTTTVTDNYDIKTDKGKLTIEKAENPITVTTPQTWSTTFSTGTQTKVLTSATGAQGSVTYAIQSQKNSSSTAVTYFTLSGTTLTMAASTPVSGSTYTVVIRATATGNSNYNSGYKDITVNVVVGKAAGSISYGTTSVSKTYGDASFTNTLTKTGDGTISYTSSNTDVATVNSSTGAVTIKGAGSATITATVADGSNYTYATKTATYTLTVGKAPNPIAVTTPQTWSTTFSTGTQTKALTAATGGQGSVTYAIQSQKNSSSTAVTYFTLSGTTLTMAASTPVSGSTYTVVIRATATGNSNYNSGYKDITVNVVVSKAAGSISYGTTSVSKTYGDASFTNTLTKTGDGTVTYTSSKTDVATVNSSTGAVTIKGAGTTTITATVADGSNYTYATKTATYTLTVGKAPNPIAVTTPQTWSTTFSTGTQTKALTAATGAQGSVTYAIQSQKNSSSTAVTYFTLSGTTLTMAASTPVSGSTYTVVIRATAEGNSNYNSGYKDITVNVVVGKAAGSISYATKTVTKTYGDASFTNTLTKTGDGTISYTSSNTDVATVNSSTGAVTIKGAGSATITATVADGDNYTYATKTATYTLTVGKQKVNAPTNVAVSTAGIVTWTNSSNATGYQISIDNSNWTTFTSGSSYLSTITAGTGSRTVYVRAVNSDTTNYDTPSSSASKTVSVYKVTIQSNNTTGGTVNTTSLNVISGATYTTSSNVLTIKGGSTTLGTSTATAKTGYNFSSWSPTSGTITSATTITANFTANTNTAYKVEHYVMNTSGSYSTTATSSENKTGTTASSLTLANLKLTTSAYNVANGIVYSHGTVSGSTVTSTTINADGSLVIKLYYKRTYGMLTTAAGTNVSSVTTQNKVKYYYGATVPTLTATLSSSTGYTYAFSKWTSSNTTYLANKTTNPTGTFTWPAMPEGTEITLTASATKTANTYTIAYSYAGGSKGTNAPTSGTYDSDVQISNPTRTGYTFAGWTTSTSAGLGSNAKTGTSASPTTAWTGSATKNTYFRNLRDTSGTVTLTATWTANSYTVSFNPNGGKVSTLSKSVTYGSTYGTLPTPSRSGYTFSGWYTATSGGSQRSSSSTVTITAAETLYARWTATTPTVTYDAQGGSAGTASKSVTYNSTYSTLTTATRSGYSFNGWQLVPNEYQQVDYIASSGTQYIDTGYYWKNEGIEIYFDGIVTSNSSGQSLFGNEEVIDASGNRNFAGIPHGSNGNYAIYIGNGSQFSVSTTVGTRFNLSIQTTNENNRLFVYKNGSSAGSSTYSGSVKTQSNIYKTSGGTSTTIGHIFLFANHNTSKGTSNAAIQQVGGMKVYAFKLYDNGTLVRDMVPCYRKSDNVVGMYDIVNNKFYTSGSGSFTKGSNTYITTSSTVTVVGNHKLYASWSASSYTVTLNSNNLIYGLEDIETTSNSYINYSVSNKVVTATAKRTDSTDAYGYINARANLESGTNYIFNATSSGTWPSEVEAFVMYNGSTANNYYTGLSGNVNKTFTVPTSGTYWLRLDVNQASGATETFENLNISKNLGTTTATYGNALSSVTVPTRTGYTFGGYYSTMNAIDLTSAINVFTSTVRISLLGPNNGWKLSNADAGSHIQAVFTLKDTSLSSAPNIEFNDVRLTNGTDYTVNGSGGTWTYYVDFDITENMVSLRGSTPYDTTYRFIDVEGTGSSASVTVSSAVKDGKKYYNASGASVWNYDVAGATTLYAKWIPYTYTIAYACNGGTCNGPTTATYDSRVNISNPTRDNYSFTGWTFNGNTSTAKYGTKASIDTAWSSASTKVSSTYFRNLTATNGGTVTMTANWNSNTVTLPITSGSGGSVKVESSTATVTVASGGSSSITVNIGDTVKVTATPSSGYSLSTLKHGSTSISSGGTFTAPSSAETIAATWTANIYSVTLDNNGATSAGTTKVWYQYNTTKTVNGVTCYYFTDSALSTCLSSGYIITKPTKTGWTFNGYFHTNGTQYINSSGSFINNLYKTVGNHTLTANWINPTPPTLSYTASNDQGTYNGDGSMWARSYVTTTISATATAAGRNIEKIQYILQSTYDDNPSASWTTFGFSLGTLTQSGTTWTGTEGWGDTDGRNQSYYFRACDTAGLCTTEANFAKYTIKYDKSAPSVPTYTATFDDGSGGYTSGNWANKQVNTLLTSTDSYSGVIKFQYQKNGGSWSDLSLGESGGLNKSGSTATGTEGWSVYDNRNDNIYFRACDAAGNCSGSSSLYNIKYDTTAPSTPNISRTDGNTFSYSSSDTAGVTGYYVSTSSTTPTIGSPSSGFALNKWTTATSTGDLSLTAGTYYVWARDQAGNISGSASIAAYTLTLSKGTGISSVSGAGTYLNGTSVSISATASSGYTFSSWTKSAGSSPASTSAASTTVTLAANTTLTANATLNSSTYTATIYYYNGSAVTSTTTSCTASGTQTSCTASIPSAVTGSTGPYASAYKGLATALSSMSYSTSITLSANATYYTVYSSRISVVYPTSASACSSSSSLAIYRNEYFTSTSAMGAVIAGSDSSKTAISSLSISGITGTLAGLTSSANSTSTVGMSNVSSTYAKTTNKTLYAKSTTTITLTYNANSGTGAPSASTGTRSFYCTSSTAGTATGANITINNSTKPTRSNYSFLGYSTSSSATSVSYYTGTSYTFTSNTTIYAVWEKNVYQLSAGSSTYAPSLSTAVSRLTSGGTITALENNSTGAVTISKNLTLNSNGKTITQTGSITISSGYTVTVTGTGTFTTSSSHNFNNAGTLTISGSKINNTSANYGIYTTGNLTINGSGVNVTTVDSAVLLASGSLSMSAGSLTGEHGIAVSGGSATISGGTLTGNVNEGIWVSGSNVTVTNGVISGVTHGIRVVGTSNVSISGGTISGPNAVYGLGGSTITIGGGTFTGSSEGIYYGGTGTVTMTAGTVKSTAHRGVEIASAGKFVMSGGTVEGSTSQTYAAVWTSNASANASITGGTLSGYHGIGGSAGNIDVSNAKITASYCGIYGAGTANVTINSGTITSSGYGSIWRDGTLTIKGGTITSASGNTGIYFNKGTINMSGGKVSSPNSHGIYYKKTQTDYSGNGTITISGGTVSGGHAVNEEDSTAFKMTFNMSGGKIEATGYGLIVRAGSTATITGGTLTSSGTLQTVWYKGTVTFGSNNGTVSTSSPAIYNTGTSANAVHNAGSGTWNFYDGIIYGKNLYNNKPTAVATGYYVLTASDSTYTNKAYLSNADGWVTVGSNKYYYKNGAPLTGTQTISGSTYYFNSSGVMQTGWQQISNYWYYFNSSGVMQKGSTAVNTASAFYLSRDSSSGWYSFTTDGKNIYVQTSAAQSYATSAVNFYKSSFTSSKTTANVKYALYHTNATSLAIVKAQYDSSATSTSALGVVLQTAASSATPVYTSNNYPSSSSRQTKCYYYGTDAVYTGSDSNGKCP